jgi:excisionase family DNA binding protein
MSEKALKLEPLLVKVREAARLLGVSERQLFNLTAAGELRPIYLGRAKRYDPADLRRFVDQRKGAAHGRRQ